jgi:hypothetical protein
MQYLEVYVINTLSYFDNFQVQLLTVTVPVAIHFVRLRQW